MKLSNSGAILSGANGFTVGGLGGASGIAIDGSGNAWVANENLRTNSGHGSLTELSSSGSPLSGANGFTGGGLGYLEHVAIDGSGDVWVANIQDSSVCEMIGAATPVTTPICAGLPVTPTSDGTSNLGTRP